MITLSQTYTAVAPNARVFFLAAGGLEPYTYSVLPDGAGGAIDDTGLYTAPNEANSDPNLSTDTIEVTDANSENVQAQILVGSPLLLFCDILQHELNLDNNHVYLWGQKLFQPSDAGLYIAVSVASCKPFGSSNEIVPGATGMNQIQSVNMQATLDLDLISRGPQARDRKEEVILALVSQYAQQQQEANAFRIGRLPAGSRFINLSPIDGAAIPYRFRVSINLIYSTRTTQQAQHFDTFLTPEISITP